MLEINDAQGPHQFGNKVALFVVEGGAPDGGQGLGAPHLHPAGGFGDKGGVPGVLNPLGQGGDGPLQRFFLPMVASRGPVQDLFQASGAGDHLEDRLAFAAQSPLVNGMIWIAFHGHELVVDRVGYKPAANAAERADGGGLGGSFGFGRMHEAGPALTDKDHVIQA